MLSLVTIAALCLLSYGFYRAGRTYVLASSNSLAALPSFYGWCSVFWFASITCLSIAALSATGIFSPLINSILAIITGILITTILIKKRITPTFKARHHIEYWIKSFLFLCACISIAITIAIVLSMLFESVRFFQKVSFFDFFFGLKWSPLSSDKFGMVPVFLGTLLITLIAMLIAIPIGILGAAYLTEYCSKTTRNRIKPILEILAGIPTVVYGYFAAILIAPLLRDLGELAGLSIASESALTTGLVMGIMIIPFILSLTDSALHAVPKALKDASLALGATTSETITKVLIPAAFPGITSAILLGISRAIGETMIVVMAAGFAANLTFNPFESVTTVTVQIVNVLKGDQEFDSAKTLSAFALGLTLFVITLGLNILSNIVSKKYQRAL